MMDYTALESLAAIIEEQSFERAARRLRISQPAISQRLKSLEDQIGQLLLVRGQPLQATAEGQKYLSHYRKVAHLEQELRESVSLEGGGTQHTLSLGVNADSLATWFLPVIQSFIEKYEVILQVHVEDEHVSHNLLKEGKVMACVTREDQPLRGCAIERLGVAHYLMVCTPEFEERWFSKGLNRIAISQAPAIRFAAGDFLHEIALNKLFQKPPDNYPCHQIPSSRDAVHFAVQGQGYVMLPLAQALPLIKEGVLVDLKPGFSLPVQLYWHCWSFESNFLRELNACILEGVKDHLFFRAPQ